MANEKLDCSVCGSSFQVFNLKGVSIRCPICGSLEKNLFKSEGDGFIRKPRANNIPPPVKKIPDNIKPKVLPQVKVQAEKLNDSLQKIDMIGKFECVNCLHTFNFEMSRGKPTCPKCGQLELIRIISPLARVVTEEDKPPLTARDIKRIKFITRNWRKFKTIENQMEGLTQLLETSDLPKERNNYLTMIMKDIMAELDKAHETKIKIYLADKGLSE